MNGQVNEIFELTRKLSDPKQTKSDMNDAMALVAGMFRDRYISRMYDTLNEMKERSRVEPPKEAALLRSLKPFMRENTHERIDKLVEFMILADALRKLGVESGGAGFAQTAPPEGNGAYEPGWHSANG